MSTVLSSCRICLGALALASVFLAGAAGPGAPPEKRLPDGALPDFEALMPASLRVHPLTRVVRTGGGGVEGGGEVQIACHIELRDRFGQVCKGLGKLRIELYRPRGFESGEPDSPSGAGGGGSTQERVWEVDLRDPEFNAQQFDDFVTRTYLVYLTGLPEWLQKWAGTAETREGDERSVTINASFTMLDLRGKEHRIEGGMRLRP